MNCDERVRLLSVHNKAALAISRTVEDLLDGGVGGSRVMYEIRRHAAGKARAGFELAWRAYEAHVDQHGCEVSNFVGTKAVRYTVAEADRFSAVLDYWLHDAGSGTASAGF